MWLGIETCVDRIKLRQLLALAAAQEFVVSTRQGTELGFSAEMMRKATRPGLLRRQRRSVYGLAGVPGSWRQRLVTAALAAGPDAVISHRSAAVLHHFDGIVADTPELLFPHHCRRQLQGVLVHRSRTLDPIDITVVGGLRVTTPIRTVIDLAPMVGDYLLGRILDEGAISRLWTAEQVLAHVEQLARPGRTGVNRLRSLLALRLDEGHPHSVLEQRVWRVLRAASVPHFETHHVVTIEGQRIEMDLAWLDQKIDGEVDGLAVRRSRTKFEQVSRRDNLLGADGWHIVHFTAQMTDSELVAAATRCLR